MVYNSFVLKDGNQRGTSPSLNRLIDCNELATNPDLAKQLGLPVEKVLESLRGTGLFFPIIICS